jgi:hypothetical protein
MIEALGFQWSLRNRGGFLQQGIQQVRPLQQPQPPPPPAVVHHIENPSLKRWQQRNHQQRIQHVQHLQQQQQPPPAVRVVHKIENPSHAKSQKVCDVLRDLLPDPKIWGHLGS